MNILITGGTGLIGRALIAELTGHNITVLTRSVLDAKQRLGAGLTYITSLDELADFNQLDAVINLAGEPIIDKRWTSAQKQRICQSRWQLTEQLVQQITRATTPPRILISGSAVGIYGDRKNEPIDEHSAINGDSFARQVCEQWENIALGAQSEQTRVCLLRTGIVLSKDGGAVQKMLPSFKLGVGGCIGNGNQYYPWIHLFDVVQAILHLLNHPTLNGAFNITAPNPVTNRVFCQRFAKALNRPCLFMLPSCVLSLTLGEASQLLLDSQRVLPNALLDSGYQFRFADIDAAFKQLFA